MKTKLFNALKTGLSLLEDPNAVRALAKWPKFSVTSYFMVSGMLKQGIRPKTVIDVGANVGQFAVASAKLFPGCNVHSFEPVPESVAKLKENVSGLPVAVHPVALGEERGDILFHVNAHTHSSSALPLEDAHLAAFPEAKETATITVEVSTLDEVFENIDLPGPVLLKLDVQGYEPQTLKGGGNTLERVDYVVLEASFKPMYKGEMLFTDVVGSMEERGFRFERPVGWLAAPGTGEILQADALFARNR